MNTTTIASWITILMPILLIVGSAPADIGLSLIAVFFLAHSAINDEWNWLKQSWILCVLAIWGYLNIRNLFVDDLALSLRRSLSWIRYPIFAAALSCWVLRDDLTKSRLYKSMLAGTAFLAADGLWQYFSGTDILSRERIMVAGYPRLTGPYGDPMLGIMLVWVSFPIISIAWKKYSWLQAIIALAILATIFLSGERMAFLLLLFGMALLLFTSHKKIRMMLIAATLALGIGLFSFAPDTVNRQVDSVIENTKHLEQSPYGLIWTSALNIAKENPIFGIGSNQFRAICPNEEYGTISPEFRCNQHPHHLYLEWLLDGGIIGLLLFIGLIASLARIIWQNWFSLYSNPIFIGLVITIFIRLWPLSTSGSFFTSWVAAPFWLMLGWLLAYCHRNEKN